MVHVVNSYYSYQRQGIDTMREKEPMTLGVIRADGGPDPRRYNVPTAL